MIHVIRILKIISKTVDEEKLIHIYLRERFLKLFLKILNDGNRDCYIFLWTFVNNFE